MSKNATNRSETYSFVAWNIRWWKSGIKDPKSLQHQIITERMVPVPFQTLISIWLFSTGTTLRLEICFRGISSEMDGRYLLGISAWERGCALLGLVLPLNCQNCPELNFAKITELNWDQEGQKSSTKTFQEGSNYLAVLLWYIIERKTAWMFFWCTIEKRRMKNVTVILASMPERINWNFSQRNFSIGQVKIQRAATTKAILCPR